MQLAHKVKLKPNNNQITYFKKACGVARFAWNWALNRWNELYASGDKPSGFSLKKEFNSIKKEQFPFVYNASINLNKLNTVPPVRRELTAVETSALLCRQGMATSVVETASEQQTYMVRFA